MNEGDRRHRLASLHDISESMREPVETPDLTAQILHRVDSRRAFLDRQSRRKLWITRGSIGLATVAIAGAVAGVIRLAPGTFVPVGPAPLTEVVTAAESRTASGFATLRETIESVETPDSPQRLVELVLGTEASSPSTASVVAAAPESEPVRLKPEPRLTVERRSPSTIAASYSPDPRLSRVRWSSQGLRSLVGNDFSLTPTFPNAGTRWARPHAMPAPPASEFAPLLPVGSGGLVPR